MTTTWKSRPYVTPSVPSKAPASSDGSDDDDGYSYEDEDGDDDEDEEESEVEDEDDEDYDEDEDSDYEEDSDEESGGDSDEDSDEVDEDDEDDEDGSDDDDSLMNDLSLRAAAVSITTPTVSTDQGPISRSMQDTETSVPAADNTRIDGGCIICCSRAADTVLMPCKHLALCRVCCDKMGIKEKEDPEPRTVKCPICRVVILDRPRKSTLQKGSHLLLSLSCTRVLSNTSFGEVVQRVSVVIKKRNSTKVEGTGDSEGSNKVGIAFPHRHVFQPEPEMSTIRKNRPSTSATREMVPTRRFPALSRLFGASIFVARIPFVRAGDIGNEFTNNFITDLAPLLALFGERVATQFMSQSFSIADSIIFAVAPLGIMTAMVGAIRVGGPHELKAIIGRARESRSAIELELMSSTSSDVCELWNGEGVVRALGKPLIVELIYVIPEPRNNDDDESEQASLVKRWEADVGVYDFNTAIRQLHENRLLTPRSLDDNHNPDSEDSAPNISLNIGGQVVSDLELLVVAMIGVLLQLGVVVFAGLSVLLPPWNERFGKEGKAVAAQGFPLMAGGTLALVLGMFLCSYVVERSTVEETWEIKKLEGARVQVAWLQKSGIVNDQLFDSHALFPHIAKARAPTNPNYNRFIVAPLSGAIQPIRRLQYILIRQRWYRYIQPHIRACAQFVAHYPTRLFRSLEKLKNSNSRPSIRTSRKAQVTHQRSFVVIAVGVSLCGFFAQFMGLRWLHWSVTVAQLVVTVVMTVLRAWVRRNLIHKPVDKKVQSGYELEWMAREVKNCQRWNVVTWGFDNSKIVDNNSAANVMTTRRRLGALSKWPSQWSSAIDSTTQAIEDTMNFLFSSEDITLQKDYWSTRDRFEWKIVVEVETHSAGSRFEEITLNLKRSRLLDGPWGPWRATRSEVEAVLGLWMLHFKDLEAVQEKKLQDGVGNDWQRDEEDLLRGKPTLRVLGPYNRLGRMDYERWIGRQSHYLKIEELAKFTEGENKRCDHVLANPTEAILDPTSPVLGVISDTLLDFVCGQIVFGEFMSNVAEHVVVGGKVCIRGGDKGEKDSFGLSSTGLAGLVEVVERAELANTEEAYMSIVPALSRSESLPTRPDIETFTDIVEAVNSHIKEGRLEKAGWFSLWLFHYAETSAGLCNSRKEWMKAGEIYLHLRRICETISHPNEYTDEVDRRLTLFCEKIFTLVAAGTQDENPVVSSSTLELVCISMSSVLGEIPGKTLAVWKAKNDEGTLPAPQTTKEQQLLQAVIAGKTLLVEQLLRDGADIETHDTSLRTPLVLACIYGHAAVADQLIQKNAKISTQDYYGRTSLHYASENGCASVVQILLLCDGPIDTRDKKGQTPLQLALKMNAGAVISLLLFYGAEDLNGEARKLLHESSRKGLETAVNAILLKIEDINLRDVEYQRAPVHWSVWRGSQRALKLLLDKKPNVQARDKSEQTPLHIAAMNGSLNILKILLSQGVNEAAKDILGRTAFHYAAGGGHKGIVRLLLEQGADKDERDKNGQTALYMAAEGGHKETAQLLLDYGADNKLIDNSGQTALHKAAENGHQETVQLLLDRGASKEVITSRGEMALHKAADGGHHEVVGLLLDRGANMEASDGDGGTALHRAAGGGHHETLRLLLVRGANKEASDGDGGTALHRAAGGGHHEAVGLLLDRGVNKEASDSTGWTALHWAAGGGHHETVRLLLDRGASREASNNTGWTALGWAAGNGHHETVRLLLDRGANREASNDIGWTALGWAAGSGHQETVRLLLDRGANREASNSSGWTALGWAAGSGHHETVRLLLDRGANIEASNSTGYTALGWAAGGGHHETVRLLLDRGANMEVSGSDGETALHRAAGIGHHETVRLLLDRGANKGARNNSGLTALAMAISNKQQAVIDILRAS